MSRCNVWLVLIQCYWTTVSISRISVVLAAGAATTGSGSTNGLVRRFARQGPVLTVTLPSTSSSTSTSSDDAMSQPNILSALEPSLTYSIASQQPPLPNWLPCLKSLATGVGYQTLTGSSSSTHRQGFRGVLPSWMEACAKFQFDVTQNVQWQIQPRHDWTTQTTSVLLQANRGATQSLYARWMQKHMRDSDDAPCVVRGLDAIQASVQWPLPLASLASLRLTPKLTWNKQGHNRPHVSCEVQAVTGGAGRTVATLGVNLDRPTLSVQYQPDAHNWIKPVIELTTGHMTYEWIVALPHQSGSVHTLVDPLTAIDVTWTDHSSDGRSNEKSGAWVTNVRVPLSGTATTLRTLAADIRVRRQFRF